MAQLAGCDCHHKVPFPPLGVRGTPPCGWGEHPEGGREEPGCSSLSVCTPVAQRNLWQGRCSARVLLLVAQVELPQLPLPHAPRLVGFGGAAGAGGLR